MVHESLRPGRSTLLAVLVCGGTLTLAGAADAQTDATPLVPAAEESYPSLQVRGFSDLSYAFANPGGFSLGQFVLHLTSPLAKKTSFFGELSASPHVHEFSFEVERSFIRYDYNDAFKISFGRYHTPIGYWNNAFHHGLWLQTTIRRPEYIRFGSTFVPVHFIGAVAEGRVPSGPLGLGYAAGIGNGRSEVLSRGGDAGDANRHRAWIVQVTSRPIAPFGLETGAALYRDRRTADPLLPLNLVDEWIGSFHAAWSRETPELLFEYILVRHEDRGVEEESRAFYAQGAYRLPGRLHFAKPYARYEEIRADAEVRALVTDGTQDVQIVTAGIRLDLIPLAAFKVEYRNELEQGGRRIESTLLQTSFTF